MPNDAIELSDLIPAAPRQIYEAWLDHDAHSAMTGTETTVEGHGVGARFMAGNGYIVGRCLRLEIDRRIVFDLRSLDFPADASDSTAEVILEPVEGGTRVTIRQTNIPAGQGEAFRRGWKESYFERMKRYFADLAVSSLGAGMSRRAG